MCKDIHKETASKLFNVPENEVTLDMRSVGKGLNFWMNYDCKYKPIKDDLIEFNHMDICNLVRIFPKLDGKVYGVKRAGNIPATIYAQMHDLEMTDNILEADIIIDDVVSKGRTYREIEELFKNNNKDFSKVRYMSLVWEEEKSGIKVDMVKKIGILVNPFSWILFPFDIIGSELYDRDSFNKN